MLYKMLVVLKNILMVFLKIIFINKIWANFTSLKHMLSYKGMHNGFKMKGRQQKYKYGCKNVANVLFYGKVIYG